MRQKGVFIESIARAEKQKIRLQELGLINPGKNKSKKPEKSNKFKSNYEITEKKRQHLEMKNYAHNLVIKYARYNEMRTNEE